MNSTPRQLCSSPPTLPGISVLCVGCFRQAAQSTPLKTALSTAFPATPRNLACQMILVLLVDHSPNRSWLKHHFITFLLLWFVPQDHGKEEKSCRVGLLACRSCSGTRQWLFSCPILPRPVGLATHRGFSFDSPLWEGIPLCWQHGMAPGAVSLMFSLGDCQAAGEG